MYKMLKDAFILCIITLTAGALLASVYEITKKPIQEQALLAQQKACQEVFNTAVAFEENTDLIKPLQTKIEEQGYDMEEINHILLAKANDNSVLGYVFEICEKEGYGGDITFMVGITKDGTVNGISILSINETAGLGMNATSPDFTTQFSNKKVVSFAYTKTGSTQDSEIDAISGATITTNAMVNGVNAAIEAYRLIEKEGE